MIHVLSFVSFFVHNLFKYCDTMVAPAMAAQAVPYWESPDRILTYVYSVLCLFISNKTSSFLLSFPSYLTLSWAISWLLLYMHLCWDPSSAMLPAIPQLLSVTHLSLQTYTQIIYIKLLPSFFFPDTFVGITECCNQPTDERNSKNVTTLWVDVLNLWKFPTI